MYPTQVISNPASVTWRSLSASVPSGVYRNYPYRSVPLAVAQGLPFDNADSSNFTASASSVVQDVVVSMVNLTSSLPDTRDPFVAVGEVVTFTVTAIMVQATSPVVMRCQLPTGVTLGGGKLGVLSSRVVYLGTALTASRGAVNSSGVMTDSNTDGVVDRVVFDFGQVVDAPHGVKTEEADSIVIEGTQASAPNSL